MSGILAFLAGAGTGAMKGMQMREDREGRAEDRAWQREQRDRLRKQGREEDDLRSNLKAAAQPIAMTEGAGGMVRPDTMDNRDVGLPENGAQPNAGLMPVAYRVGAQGYENRSAAQAAVQQQNSPQAVNSRVVAAYRGAGQVDKAMQLESGARTAEMQDMQLADTRWRRDLGTAMRGGHAGLAKLATQSEAGPMAGMKVSLVQSEDGKTVRYAAMGEGGALTPIPGLPEFSNDERGVTQAAWTLDKAIPPEARLAHFQALDDRKQKRDDRSVDVGFKERELDIRQRESNSRIELNGAKAENMALRASIAGGRASAKEGPAGFDPLADFDPKQARKGAMDQALKESELSGKPVGETEIAKRAQAIYANLRDAAAADNTSRQRATVFASAARAAKTPEEVEAVRTRAIQSGYTTEEMARLDPRFSPRRAPPAQQPAVAPAQPVLAQGVPGRGAQAASAPPQAPTDMASAKLDAARARFADLRARPAPGLAAGRAAIDAHGAEIEAARREIATAQAEYQRAVPTQGPAFVSPR